MASPLSGAALPLDRSSPRTLLSGSWGSADTVVARKKIQLAHMFVLLLDRSRCDTGHGTHTLDIRSPRLSVSFNKKFFIIFKLPSLLLLNLLFLASYFVLLWLKFPYLMAKFK